MSPFLVVYNRSTGQVSVEEFDDSAIAMEARLNLESTLGSEVEVVVLSSESAEKMRETHSRYFKSATEILKISQKLIEESSASA